MLRPLRATNTTKQLPQSRLREQMKVTESGGISAEVPAIQIIHEFCTISFDNYFKAFIIFE